MALIAPNTRVAVLALAVLVAALALGWLVPQGLAISARSRATPSRPPTPQWVPRSLKAEVPGVAEDGGGKGLQLLPQDAEGPTRQQPASS